MATPELDSGALQWNPQTGALPLDWPILVQTLRTLRPGQLRTMAGGGKHANSKRLKKAGDIASHGREPPQAEVGTSKATEKGRKRRQGQETSGPSEAAGADQEQWPARERPGLSETEGGQPELRCREGPGPSEAAEAVEATEAMEERRPARDTPRPSAAMGLEQEWPSEAAEWYASVGG